MNILGAGREILHSEKSHSEVFNFFTKRMENIIFRFPIKISDKKWYYNGIVNFTSALSNVLSMFSLNEKPLLKMWLKQV